MVIYPAVPKSAPCSNAWLALKAPAGYTCFPHWIEFTIIAAAFAAGILLFSLGIRYLPGLDKAALKVGVDQ